MITRDDLWGKMNVKIGNKDNVNFKFNSDQILRTHLSLCKKNILITRRQKDRKIFSVLHSCHKNKLQNLLIRKIINTTNILL